MNKILLILIVIILAIPAPAAAQTDAVYCRVPTVYGTTGVPIFAAASTSSAIVDRAPGGSILLVYSTNIDWRFVRGPSGVAGFIRAYQCILIADQIYLPMVRRDWGWIGD